MDSDWLGQQVGGVAERHLYCEVSKVKLRLLYCHPPQLRPATPGL